MNQAEMPVQASRTYAPAPDGDSDEHAGVFHVPANMPEVTMLGPLLEVYCTRKVGVLQVIFITACFVTMFGFALLAGYYQVSNWAVARAAVMAMYIGIAGLFVVPVVIFSFFYTRIAYQTILLFEGGIVRYRFGRIHVFPWPDIKEIYLYEAALPEMRNDLQFNKGEAPILVHRNGSKVDFASLSEDKRRKLDLYVLQEVRQHLRPSMLETYEDGEVVQFGPLGISKSGLVRGTNTIAWADIARLYIDLRKNLCIVRKGSVFRWFSKPIWRIPNFYLLREFIERHFPMEVQQKIN
jgi:hypothetical protein